MRYLCSPALFTTIFFLFCLLLSACSTQQPLRKYPPVTQQDSPSITSALPLNKTTPSATTHSVTKKNNLEFYRPGNDTLFTKPKTVATRVQKDGSITLNFHKASLPGVVKVILGDMLQAAYVIDPKVQGTVSMQTGQPIHQDDLLPTLELLLRMHQAAVILDKNVYKVVALDQAILGVRQPQLGDSSVPLPQGFSIRVVPLRFVSAVEMAQVLAPFMSGSNQLVRSDEQRNLLVLAASGHDMQRLLDIIHMFDVDRMQGMSIALFIPDFVAAKTLSQELEALLNDTQTGLLPGMVRFTVIERLNGLMVVTSRARYLALVRDWIQRLDKDQNNASQRLFVYRVQNGKAADLAAMLNQVFTPKSAQSGAPKVQLAPGRIPTEMGQNSLSTTHQLDALGFAVHADAKVRIIADEPNNALLILASSATYQHIVRALHQLDISPMQVLVEVTIAEVSLNDNLRYGVEWFFNNQVGGRFKGLGNLDLGNAGVAALAPGFSYALQGAGAVKAVINVLASESNLSIVSSPALLVLNNQEATIQVGDEVPVSTQQQQATTTGATIINSIEYRKTGLLLRVKPRINAGGLVIMEITQEASLVPNANNADPLTPRIQTRKINSTVAVHSGDTIMLGGLIENNQDNSAAGVPLLHRLPLIGHLFGSTAISQDRTELLILITPRAIYHRDDMLHITESFRHKMQRLLPTLAPIGPTNDIMAQPSR